MILASYQSLRHHFAEVARTTGVSLTYAAGPPATITRGAGSFVTDGFVAGQSVDIANTTSNDKRVLLDTVAALTLTLDSGETLTNEGPVTSSLTGAFYENDGAEQWPTANVRAGGFSSTWSLGPQPITICPAQLTVNGLVSDVTAGTSYRWYLRQRTDVAADQWLAIQHANPLFTGTVALTITAAGVAALGLASATTKMTTDQQIRLLRNVTVYVLRDSDGAIQFVDLLQLSHGAYA